MVYVSFPTMFSCTNVYNHTVCIQKSQSSYLLKNICPWEKNIVGYDMEILVDRTRKTGTMGGIVQMHKKDGVQLRNMPNCSGGDGGVQWKKSEKEGSG